MKPCILLVEDDPVSRAFLAAAAEALPASVDAVATCAEALRCVPGQPDYALWLIDANLPDGSGAGLLASLRERGADTPALAHTASRDSTALDALIAAGFAEVLVKPLAAIALQAAICRVLGHDLAPADAETGRCVKLPQWDDAAALSALKGEQAHVVALRRLFLDELPGQRLAIDAALADGDAERACRELHKLRASCGFVGAARLGEAVRVLEGDPRSALALQRFDEAATDLLDPR
ncbi:MAG: response regulator [Luteimonas sp.]